MATLRERYATGLIARGEHLVKKTFKFDVYSRRDGGFYYLGRAGSIRIGKTVAGSIPVYDSVKRLLLEEENFS